MRQRDAVPYRAVAVRVRETAVRDDGERRWKIVEMKCENLFLFLCDLDVEMERGGTFYLLHLIVMYIYELLHAQATRTLSLSLLISFHDDPRRWRVPRCDETVAAATSSAARLRLLSCSQYFAP